MGNELPMEFFTRGILGTITRESVVYANAILAGQTKTCDAGACRVLPGVVVSSAFLLF